MHHVLNLSQNAPRFALYRQDNWITFNEQELVSDMPSGLRADVVTHVHANTIAQIPWLEGKDKEFVADLVVLLKPRLFMVRAVRHIVKRKRTSMSGRGGWQ